MKVTLAATQFRCVENSVENLNRAESLVRDAARKGAQVILLQELFETPYFCKDHLASHFDLARPIEGSPVVQRFQALARELSVVLPLSVFERASNAYFNSLVMIDADGTALGTYRKSHIPEGPGYHEKYYFSPGDTGFRVWRTRYGRIGAAICWDQWFPESARCMALMGADVLLYPTAIGSEPHDASMDTRDHWQRCMQGHAAANLVPLVASNRVGSERGQKYQMTFYGSSFIAGPTGEKVVEADRESETVLTATFDLEAVRAQRHAWGVFRDRRPDLYGPLLTLDGKTSRTG
jgi:N-carbamoylputrescine amidase